MHINCIYCSSYHHTTLQLINYPLAVGVLALQPSDVAIVVEDRGFVEVCAVINSVTLERDVIATIRTFPTEPVTAIGISSIHILSERFIHMYYCYCGYIYLRIVIIKG